MGSDKAYVDDLRTAVAEGTTALIIGAGVSAAASGGNPLASWRGLLSSALDSLRQVSEAHIDTWATTLADAQATEELTAVAEFVRTSFLRFEGEYVRWLRETVGSLQVVDRTLLDALPPSDYVLTTNYDNFLIESTGRAMRTWTDKNAVTEFSREHSKYVFHLHGHYSDYVSIILGGSDYGRLAANGRVQELLRSLADRKSLVFVGYGAGFDDITFSTLVEWIRREQETSPHRHYYLVREGQVSKERHAQLLRARIAPVVYGKRHDELPGFLADLHPPVAAGGPAQSPAPGGGDQLATGVDESAGLLSSRLAAILPDQVIDLVRGNLGPLDELDAFQAQALDVCLRMNENSSSGLLCAATGIGKTTIARVAMNLAVSGQRSAIQLLPTKALVTQEAAEWDAFVDAWAKVNDRGIRVYKSSRDYPQNDRPVSRGRYDVAVAIYEKLGVYLVSGRTPLSNTAIAVVDELQMLVENSARAAKLEAILTLINQMPKASRPFILGLSATLPPEASTALRRWLDIDDDKLVSSNRRPVPLDTYVMDTQRWKKQQDSHLFSIPGEIPPPAGVSVEHDLGNKLTANSAILAGKLRKLPSGELAATLVDHLLDSDQTRKIICFVPSRTAAQELALAIQTLQKRRLGPVPKGSPWSVGRFACGVSESDARARLDALKYSALPNADDVIRGLREGVAFHTAAVPSALRRKLEDEFRRDDGLLRVLVATDTLAIGMNLPADTVVATSLSGYMGDIAAAGSKRLLSPADLDNKAGRAGRRGHMKRERGEFYLLVPSKNELQDVQGLTADQVTDLSTTDGVFDQYVSNPHRIGGITSKYRNLAQISSLVLQVHCQDGFARTEQKWLSRTSEIVSGLLVAQEPQVVLPSAENVLRELRDRRLVGARFNGKLALTGLGVALARSSLDLDAARTLEQIARIACANAGLLDLLWTACRSETIQTVTDWVSLPPVNARHHPSMKDAVLNLANAYAADELRIRRLCEQQCRSKKKLPRQLVEEGSPVVSPEMRRLLEQDGEDASDADITALLRALVAYEWSRGIPFGDIKARFSSAVSSDEVQRGQQPVELKIYYADVEQLCEQVAGLLNSASEISVSMDNLDYSMRVRGLAAEVEVGLPAWLAPIARLRIPGLHRERLTFLWENDPPVELVHVLDHAELTENKGITPKELKSARDEIERYEHDNRVYRNQIAQRWASEVIPGGDGDTFEDVSERLTESHDAEDYLENLNAVITCLDVLASPIVTSKHFVTTKWTAGGHSVTVHVPHKLLSSVAVRDVSADQSVVVLRLGLEPGAFRTEAPPTQARFVNPEHLLSFLAHLVQTRGPGLEAEEIVEGMNRLKVSSIDGDSWYLYDSNVTEAPPPFPGPLPAFATSSHVPQADEDLQD